MSRSDEKGRSLTFVAALGFWIVFPMPFWLLGWGFAGEPVWLPDNWDVLSVIWTIAFYVPIFVMTFCLADALRTALTDQDEKTPNAQD